MRRRPFKTAAAVLALGVLACPASAWAGSFPLMEHGGLGLMGSDVPDILKQARADPYAASAELNCASAAEELVALDEALGPDADQPALKSNQASKFAARAIRGLIPHRDILRLVTGAGRKEGALQQAVMQGWARRGFLRGVSRQMGCAPDGPVSAVAADAPVQPAKTLISTEPATLGVNP